MLNVNLGLPHTSTMAVDQISTTGLSFLNSTLQGYCFPSQFLPHQYSQYGASVEHERRDYLARRASVDDPQLTWIRDFHGTGEAKIYIRCLPARPDCSQFVFINPSHSRLRVKPLMEVGFDEDLLDNAIFSNKDRRRYGQLLLVYPIVLLPVDLQEVEDIIHVRRLLPDDSQLSS